MAYTCYHTLAIHILQGIGNGTLILTPGATIPAQLVPHSNTTRLSTDLNDFLNTQGRRCHAVVEDGNCMFRAISHQVFGLEDKHSEVRFAIQETIQVNLELYRCLWIGNGTFSEHVNNIKSCGIWGTQVELQAASDLFGIPVYIGMLNSKGIYCWCLFKPRTVNIPELPGIPLYPFTEKHIEMAQNTRRNHYDSIVPIFTGTKARLLHPNMDTQAVTSNIEID